MVLTGEESIKRSVSYFLFNCCCRDLLAASWRLAPPRKFRPVWASWRLRKTSVLQRISSTTAVAPLWAANTRIYIICIFKCTWKTESSRTVNFKNRLKISETISLCTVHHLVRKSIVRFIARILLTSALTAAMCYSNWASWKLNVLSIKILLQF